MTKRVDYIVMNIYYVSETKDSMYSVKLSEIEKFKKDCAKKFFLELKGKLVNYNVRYEVIDNNTMLLQMVS